jgi:putative FmdB family regulatory protein
MPTYEYDCPECGPFEAMRSMAEYQAPHPCPDCGADAPRAGVSAPRLMGMDAGRRNAMATNERSASAPARASRAHPSSCGCCKPGGGKLKAESVSAAKSFPAARPWMISH